MTMDLYQLCTTNLILDADSFTQVLVSNGVIDPSGNCEGTSPNLGIVRDTTGNLICVNSGTGNAGKRNVRGLEITAAYEIPTERWGKFTFSGGYNHFFTWKAQPGVGAFKSFLGNYNNQTLPFTTTLPYAPGAVPWNKGFLRGEWEWRGFDFIATGNYIGDFRDDPAFNADAASVGGPNFIGRIRTVPSYITLDLQLSYAWKKPDESAPAYAKDSRNVMTTQVNASSPTIWQRLLWGTTLTVGVHNPFDRNPPTVLAALNDNYDTSLYSIRNRYYYIAFNKKF